MAFIKELSYSDGTTVTKKGGNEPMKKKQGLFISLLITVVITVLLIGFAQSAPKAPKEIRVGKWRA